MLERSNFAGGAQAPEATAGKSAAPGAHPLRARDTTAALPNIVFLALVLCLADERRVSVVEHAFPLPQHEPTLAETRLRIFYVFGVVLSLPV